MKSFLIISLVLTLSFADGRTDLTDSRSVAENKHSSKRIARDVFGGYGAIPYTLQSTAREYSINNL